MTLTKKELHNLKREMLYKKFDGKCALCGDVLSNKWHEWKIKPTSSFVRYNGEIVIGDKGYDNLLPSCVSCNSTRLHHSPTKDDVISLENFREVLRFEFQFLQDSTYYKKAVRYHLVEETNYPIQFYFERYANS